MEPESEPESKQPHSEGAGQPARRGWASPLRWVASIAAGLVGVIVLGVLIVVTLGVTIDLSGLRGRIEAAATDALHRRVSIEGSLQLVASLWPTLQVEGIRIADPDGWPEQDLALLGQARAQLGVLALLNGDLRIEELTVSDLAVSLKRNADGEPNWLLAAAAEPASAEESPVRQPPSRDGLRIVELRNLSLNRISVSFRDAGVGEDYKLQVDEISGSAEIDQPMRLAIQGSLQEVPYAMTVAGGSLSSLFDAETPWSLDLAATAAASSLTAKGAILQPLLGKGLDLEFALTGPEMAELERLLAVELPPVRSLDLSGRIAESQGSYRISDLQGELGGTEFFGELYIDTAGERPRLRGALDVPSLDVGPIAAAVDALGDAQQEESQEIAPGEGGLQPEVQPPIEESARFDVDAKLQLLEPLKNFETDMLLTIGEVVNGPVAINDAELKLSVQGEVLTAPAKATVAGVSFRGGFRLEPENGKPAARVSLTAKESDIADLALFALGAEGIEGGFGSAELIVSAQGETVRSLVGTAELSFSLAAAALSYGHDAGQRPVEFTLDGFQLQLPAAGESQIAAAGALLGEAFSLEGSGGNLIGYFTAGDWPLTLKAEGAGASLRVDGKIRESSQAGGSNLTFSISGDRLGALSRWLGVAPDADVPYAIEGAFSDSGQRTTVSIEEGRIGNSGFAGSFGVRKAAVAPVAEIDIAIKDLDPGQLASLLPKTPAGAAQEADKETFTIDVPILPQQIKLADSDIDLTIDQIAMDPIDVSNVAFSARARNGFLEKAPFSAEFGRAAVQGNVSADMRGDVPRFELFLSSTDMDIGGLLGDLGVVEKLEATVGNIDLTLDLQGSDLRSMLSGSQLSASFGDGLLRLRDRNTAGVLDIRVHTGEVQALPGQPVSLRLDAGVKDIPVTIEIRTDSLASFTEPKDHLGASLNIELLNAQLELIGTTPLPVGTQDLRFEMEVAGQRTSDFDKLLGVSLPPWGPYKLAGAFGREASGYFIEGLRLNIGSSSMTGALRLDTTVKPPLLTVSLAAPSIQLADFDTAGWSATTGDSRTGESATDDQEVLREPSLLSPQVMNRLDGRVTVEVTEVLSGNDKLGSGSLAAELQDGRFAVEPLLLDVPGGSVKVGFALKPEEDAVELEASAMIEELDYGLLARRIDPDSTTGGLISVDVDFKTRGPNLAEVMGGANGHIDFAVWPRDLNAGLFDLWAINLFTSILPSLDSEASVVNCLVGRFGLDDGIMKPAAILVDTTRIQASAEGTVDFKENTVSISAVPRSKRPQLFSAKTPVRVEGSLSDFELGVSTGAILGTAVRMLTSPVIVPFEWVFTKNAPADGKAACERAWAGPPPG